MCPELRPDECVDAGEEEGEVGEDAVEAGQHGGRTLAQAQAAPVRPLRAATAPGRGRGPESG